MSKEYKDYSTGADIYVDYQTKSVTFDKSCNPLKGDLLPLATIFYCLLGVLMFSYELHRMPFTLTSYYSSNVYVGVGIMVLMAMSFPLILYGTFKFAMCDWYVNFEQNRKLKLVPRLTVIPNPSGTIVIDCKRSGAPLVDVEFPDSMREYVQSVSLVKTDVPKPDGKSIKRNRLTITILGNPVGDLIIKEY